MGVRTHRAFPSRVYLVCWEAVPLGRGTSRVVLPRTSGVELKWSPPPTRHAEGSSWPSDSCLCFFKNVRCKLLKSMHCRVSKDTCCKENTFSSFRSVTICFLKTSQRPVVSGLLVSVSCFVVKEAGSQNRRVMSPPEAQDQGRETP